MPRPAAQIGLRWLPVVLLAVGAVGMAFPFLWMLSTSFKPDSRVFVTPPELLTWPLRVDNYGRIADAFPFWRFALNSVGVALASTGFQVATSAMAAFAFARLRFPGREALFVVYLATLMIPLQVTVVPLFVEMRSLSLIDSYPALILPSIASAFGTFLLRQAFLSLPRDLDEAAVIDGAGYWTIFWTVLLPLVRPALATFAVFAFMASWNSFIWPLLAVNSADLMTLPVGLATLHGRYTTAWNLVMAGATVSVIPTLVVFILAQRHVVRGIAFSGIKG